MTQDLNPELLKILACPQCKAPLHQDGDSLVCQSARCRLRYPVRDGIPILLLAEARPPATP